MELSVHDLVNIESGSDLLFTKPKSNWVKTALERAPFVVVRRAPIKDNFIPVGIRGSVRSERLAALLPANRIKKRVTPEQIAQKRDWIHRDKDIFKHLNEIENIMENHSICWGPVGSVGFELASNVSTVTENSDIDIIIRYTPSLSSLLAKKLMNKLKRIPIHIDVQVEAKVGSFSLKEFACSAQNKVMFRTINGPILKSVQEI